MLSEVDGMWDSLLREEKRSQKQGDLLINRSFSIKKNTPPKTGSNKIRLGGMLY